MQKIFFVFLFCTLLISSFAQEDSIRGNFIFLFDGRIIQGRIVEPQERFLASPNEIRVDNKSYSLSNVKFYKNETGFHANASYMNFFGNNEFIERIKAGKINLYKQVRYRVNSGGGYTGGHFNPVTGTYTAGMITAPSYSKRYKYFYNTGFDDLKKANYRNLVIDLADNKQSMAYLAKYKSNTNTQIVLYTLGTAAIIGGMVSFYHVSSSAGPNEEPNMTPSIITTLGGAACFWISYAITLSKFDKIKSAIDAYNR